MGRCHFARLMPPPSGERRKKRGSHAYTAGLGRMAPRKYTIGEKIDAGCEFFWKKTRELLKHEKNQFYFLISILDRFTTFFKVALQHVPKKRTCKTDRPTVSLFCCLKRHHFLHMVADIHFQTLHL